MAGFLEYLDSKEQNINKIEEVKKEPNHIVKQETKKVVVKKTIPIPKKKIIKENDAVDHAINILEGINDENINIVNEINKSKAAVTDVITDHASALL
jgi:hypothetical protein